ncbi:GspE/PulE family protein [Nitrosomonas sp. PY1]|uniref:GspE/PulE family protein n=1 Tax=Nitrosomonas sp. PY1 TaxID=1803906 RepID=UPI001FC846CB|nr:GspE/PulE family protein [Nitrosomonas sp. PY1]
MRTSTTSLPTKDGSATNLVDGGDEKNFPNHWQPLINKIQAAETIDEIILEASKEICRLFSADRATIYTLSEDRTYLITRAKAGDSLQDLKLPLTKGSIIDYVASRKQAVNIEDVYYKGELRKIDPSMTFSHEVDKRTGYRTKQMLVVPIVSANGEKVLGVVQVINHKNNQAFSSTDMTGLMEIGCALSGILQPQPKIAQVAKSKYDHLIFGRIISADQYEQAVLTARNKRCELEDILIDELEVKAPQVGQALSLFFNVPYEGYKVDRIKPFSLLKNLKKDYIENNGWLPVDETKDEVTILALDPELIKSQRIVNNIFPKHKVIYTVTTHREFNQTIEQFYGVNADDVASGDINEMLGGMDEGDNEEGVSLNEESSAASDNELVKLVNKIIIDAHKMGVSDIHIEPYGGKEKTKIRFRKDGSLMPYIEIPASYRNPLITRIKIMCDLDISEKRKPQDGKIKFRKYAPLDIELRVATIPSAGGMEDVVMRILAAGEPIPLEKMGFTAHNQEELKKIISKPYGLFFVCGPTGSGKTTTLHSILKFLNRTDTKIWTAEDPVEITQKGLRQVQINVKAGLTFPAIMRSFLRADPDIIMVGEMRDKETTGIGIEASLTGHLVFATLHTNSAPESVIRLLDMGMDPFNFADALLGVLAQRLAKRLCKCKQAHVATEQELNALLLEYCEELNHIDRFKANPEASRQEILDDWKEQYGDEDGQITLYKPVGCDECANTGFRGRVGLHELMTASDALKKNIQEHARVADMLVTALGDGMRTLKQDGIEKVLQGITDIHQVRVVCIK